MMLCFCYLSFWFLIVCLSKGKEFPAHIRLFKKKKNGLNIKYNYRIIMCSVAWFLYYSNKCSLHGLSFTVHSFTFSYATPTTHLYQTFVCLVCQEVPSDEMVKSFLGRIGVSLMFSYHRTQDWTKVCLCMQISSQANICFI